LDSYATYKKIFGVELLNIAQLNSFCEVIEAGTFSAAASRLNVTQPAVSLQVRQLEKRLGVRLIERIGKRALPTPAGLDLLTHIRRVDSAIAGALDAMRQHATGALERVRIGTGTTACIYLLPRVLRELRQRAPLLEVVVSTGDTSDIVKAVEESKVDIGLITLPASGRMFEMTTLVEDEFMAIAPAKAFQLPGRVTPAVLAKLPLILYKSGANTRKLVDRWFARAGVTVKPIMELSSVEAIKEMVGAGVGCAVVPRLAVASKHPPSIKVSSLSPRLHRKLALIVRRDKVVQRGLREMVTALMTLVDRA
jgi:DNA-binding transcriptional LysR family regulator